MKPSESPISLCIEQACNALHEGLLFVDAEGTIIKTNHTFCSMLGYGDDEITGKNFLDVSAAGLDRLDEPLRDNIAFFKLYYFHRSEQYPLPMKLIARDGSRVQVTMRSVIMYDDTGSPAMAAGVIQKTHEPLETEEPYDHVDMQRVWEIEQNYRNILQNSGDGIIITDFNSTVLTVNEALVTMLGYDRSDEIVDRYLLELAPLQGTFTCTTGEQVTIDDTYYDEQIRVTNQLFETGRAQSMLYMLRRDRTIVPVEATLTLLTDPGGGRRGTIAICRDITERLKAEKQTMDAKAFMENVFATARDGLYVTDHAGKFVIANKAFCDITGYSHGALMGRYVPEILSPDTGEAGGGDPVNLFTETGLYETLWRRKDGSVVPVEGLVAELTDARGMAVGIVGSVRDVTEQKRVLEELQRSHEELEQKIRERTHSLEEVNTALRVLLKGREEDKQSHEEKILANINELVLPYLDRLKTTRLDDRQRSTISIIEANLKDIIEPFATKAGGRHLSLTPAEIQVVNLIKHGMSTKEIAEITSLSPRTVECHRDSIRKKLGIKNRKVNLRTYLLSSY